MMTQIAANADLIQRERISHFFTFATIACRFSGSERMMRSNSTNLPGRKNTFVMPNLNSFELSLSDISIASQKVRGASRASSGGR